MRLKKIQLVPSDRMQTYVLVLVALTKMSNYFVLFVATIAASVTFYSYLRLLMTSFLPSIAILRQSVTLTKFVLLHCVMLQGGVTLYDVTLLCLFHCVHGV